MANISLNELKIKNIKRILVELLSKGEKTKLDLVFSCGLSNTTVSDCINNLLKNGFVQSCGEGESIGGRRPAIYSLNREYGVFAGIAKVDDFFSVVITDTINEIIQHMSHPVCGERPVIDQLTDIIQSLFKTLSSKNILALGIGLDGIVDFDKGIVVSSHTLKWHNVHLKELLERRFECNVFVDNYINAVVMYQKIMGEAKASENFMLYNGNHDKKMGIYLNGNVYRGAYFSAGTVNWESIAEQWILDICQFLDLDLVICTNPIPDGVSIGSLKKGLEGRKRFYEYHSYPELYAKSAALLAEIEWFESMNYLLSGMNKN